MWWVMVLGQGGHRGGTFRAGEESVSQAVEVDESKEQVQLVGVLGQASIARLDVAPLAFEHLKGMFDFGAHQGQLAVARCLFAAQALAAHRSVEHARRVLSVSRLSSALGRSSLCRR